jgi:hypothetical protein
VVCGKDFRRNKKYCSSECHSKAQIKGKEFLFSKIKDFAKLNGRIPLKREFRNYSAVRGSFGTWNKFVKAAGFEPNPVMFAKKHVANDGHICDSLSEKIIDDWLSRRKIEHEINVSYPGRLKLTADFKIKDYWIEFFGLKGELKRYDELRKKKLGLARRKKLNLIKIYPKDLFPKGNLNELFKFLPRPLF